MKKREKVPQKFKRKPEVGGQKMKSPTPFKGEEGLGIFGILVLPTCFIWFTLHTKLLMILFYVLIVLVKSHMVLKFFPITQHFIPYPVGSRFTAISYVNRPT
jgi:hypothetical protein